MHFFFCTWRGTWPIFLNIIQYSFIVPIDPNMLQKQNLLYFVIVLFYIV